MKLFYRISDKSYDKPKLIGATKEVCLKNFLNCFGSEIFSDPPSCKLTIIADNCTEATIKLIKSIGCPLHITSFGNAGSLIHTLKQAVFECGDEELVYFCEDDYLHTYKAPGLLKEGIKRADYVTLYDHPDKYTRYYNGGEHSKVIKTETSHWRYTCSTCMTFGAKVKTLKQDMPVWEKFTEGSHPKDHDIFMTLGEAGRRLAVPIPGVACHTDLEFSNRMKQILIEPWAIDMMIESLDCDLKAITMKRVLSRVEESFLKAIEKAIREASRWEVLVKMDALLKEFNSNEAKNSEPQPI